MAAAPRVTVTGPLPLLATPSLTGLAALGAALIVEPVSDGAIVNVPPVPVTA